VSYGHKYFSDPTSFGLIADGTKNVRVKQLLFGAPGDVSISITLDDGNELILYMSPDETILLGTKLRILAIKNFEARTLALHGEPSS